MATGFEGEVLFDVVSRGRYATDASHYQVIPAAVAVPRSAADIALALDAARSEGLPVTMRGGGTSQCGQTINTGLILDCSKYLNDIIELDVEGRRALVQPGIVLDELNRRLKPHGLWFPIDVSTGSRATIGGMTGNNSCGARSLRYGTTRATTTQRRSSGVSPHDTTRREPPGPSRLAKRGGAPNRPAVTPSVASAIPYRG